MAKTFAQLTQTQQNVLAQIRGAGELSSSEGTGVRLSTVEVLEREGFVTLQRISRKVRKPRLGGGVSSSTHTEWVAKPVADKEPEPFVSIHAKCCTVEVVGGHQVVCGKSKGHTNKEHFDPSADVRWEDGYKPAKTPYVPTIARLIKTELGFEKANMPEAGGFVVHSVLWEMVPVVMIGWAYVEGSPRDHWLSPEVNKIAYLLKAHGYALNGLVQNKNHFFVVPEHLV